LKKAPRRRARWLKTTLEEIAEKDEMDQPGTLIKFGKLEYLKQLREEGLLYLNNLPYFWNIEDEELRGDPFDCAFQVIRGPKVTMVTPDGNELNVCKDYTLRIRPLEPEKINIFCMYALRPLIEGAFPIDEKNQRFGDHAIILMNRDEFLQRLESSLKSQEIVGDADLVEYVNDEHIGKLGPFRKFNKFFYQYEWRLVCYDGPGEARQIRIGSIRDISVILPFKEVNKQIQIHFEPVSEPDLP
jgi:hypothetical protein